VLGWKAISGPDGSIAELGQELLHDRVRQRAAARLFQVEAPAGAVL
jgi:hypothetical protein